MAVEDDTLKTLVRIEAILKAANQSAGQTGGASTSRFARARAALSNRDDRKQGRTFTATTKSLSDLGSAANDVERRFGKLSKTVFATQSQFVALNKSMRVFSRRPNQTANNAANTAGVGGGAASNLVAQGVNSVFGPRSPVSRAVRGLTSNIGLGRIALIGFTSQLKEVALTLTNDFYSLASRGINNAAGSMADLYIDAARAGMSLSEYTKVLEDNSAAVVRSGSMNAFNKTLQVSNSRLAGLGVFGAEANKLSATMANSATSLGIPQAQLSSSISGQVSVFEQLRKTSMITADQFAKLNEQLAANESVQAELLGMEPAQRAARYQELSRTNAIGVQMGLTADASRKLGEALLAQRKLTAVQRFQSAGTIRQAGAITGMGAAESERLAMLSRRKNRTAEENEEFTQLGGRLQASLERMQNSGNIQQEAAADQLQERLNAAGIGSQLDAAGQARLQSQSGPIINSDIGKNTGETAQTLGKIFTWLQGLGKNPIGSAIISGFGSAAFAATLAFGLKGALGSALGSIVGGAGKLGRGAAAIPGRMRGIGPAIGDAWNSAKGGVGRVGRGIGGLAGSARRGAAALGATYQMAKATSGSLSAVTGLISGGSVLKGMGTTVATIGAELAPSLVNGISGVLKGAFKFITKGGLLGSIFGGLAEAFTGDLNSALNADDPTEWFGEGGLKQFSSKLVGKIGDVIGGMVRGFAVGITSTGDFLIDAWNWTIGSFFESMRIDLGASLTNFFDRTWTDMIVMFKEMQLKMVKMIPGMGDTAKAIEADIAVAQATGKKLEENGKATLTTVGEANQKATAEQKRLAEESKKNMGVATQAIGTAAGVVSSTRGLTAVALNTAQAIKNADAVIATPGVTQRSNVTPPEVNTAQAQAAGQAAATAATEAAAAASTTNTQPTDMTTLLNQIIGLLTQGVAAERDQVSLAQQMLTSRIGPVPFADMRSGLNNAVKA